MVLFLLFDPASQFCADFVQGSADKFKSTIVH
jgi:hypothetical protein